ncbi:MAG: hypothetical protein K2L95_04705 [Alphaproteobacteria bacterium]|nr:hypothetical protein [Alphaproteobacteria bacterium]
MAGIKKIFVEYGLDFNNNKYGLGRSVEVEYTNGTEMRTHQKIKLAQITERYIRVWIGHLVLVISTKRPHISFRKKNRWNFKIVYGKSGR